MKIALVVHDYHRFGGHSRYVVELAERFKQRNEVHVFANTFRQSNDNSVRFHHIPACRLSALTTIFTFLSGTRSIARDFDIVHAQGLCSLRSDVITTHICNRAWFRARKQIEKVLPFKDYVFDAAISPLEKEVHSNTGRRVIAVSQRIRRDLADCYGRTSNVEVVHHGIDTVQFNPSNRKMWRSMMRSHLGLAERDFVFLFVGDLRKGATVAIQALADVPKAKLLLVSHTPAGFYADLGKRLGVADRLVFSPATQHIERFYAACDTFVFPTPYDAFGMVIAEAMASGLPVITTREAGGAEWIWNGIYGILLENPADPIELSRHMRWVSENPEVCRLLGGAARCVAESHGWDSVARHTMDVYEATLADRNR